MALAAHPVVDVWSTLQTSRVHSTYELDRIDSVICGRFWYVAGEHSIGEKRIYLDPEFIDTQNRVGYNLGYSTAVLVAINQGIWSHDNC